MQLGITMRINGATPKLSMDEVLEAERLGYVSVWSGEAWGTDAVSPVAWVLARTTTIKAGTAIMQMQARTPCLRGDDGDDAECAVRRPVPARRRSVRTAGDRGLARRALTASRSAAPRNTSRSSARRWRARRRSTYQGEHYQIPYAGPGATGLGKPLRSIVHGDPEHAIYTASITPAGLRTAGEVADGTLPIWFSPEQADQVVQPILDGRAKAGKPRDLEGFDLAPYVEISMGKDLAGLPRRDAAEPGTVYRRHGRAVEELLQRLRGAAGLRGGRRRRSRTCIWAGTRRTPRRACRTS